MLRLGRVLVRSNPFRKVHSSIASLYCITCVRFSTIEVYDAGQPTPISHPEMLKKGEITPGIASAEYMSRRQRLIELLPEKSLAIIASAPVKMMTDVVPYTFRQDANFLYMTGCLQPGGVAVLSKDHGFCMFMPDPDPHNSLWEGQVAGVYEALNFFNAEKAFPLRKLHEILPEMIRNGYKVFHNVDTALPSYTEIEAFQTASCKNNVKDVSIFIHELRLIKSPSEVKLMRQSASVACQSLLQTMILSKTHPEESKLAARVEYECKMRGAQRMAFNPVVGGGVNGTVIHYSRNDKKIKVGDLVLMDVGCEFNGYLSDLTRTWPPCGTFTSSQEVLYSLILETNKECIRLCKPGVSIQDIHQFSVQMLRKGLKELGILKDKDIYSYHQLNPTSIGHYLGMDIHDSSLVDNHRPLEPGVGQSLQMELVNKVAFLQKTSMMVITIEPGVYIPHSFNAPDCFQGIGIRIEDEVLITDNGHEVLTGSMPKEIPHIKSLLNFVP